MNVFKKYATIYKELKECRKEVLLKINELTPDISTFVLGVLKGHLDPNLTKHDFRWYYDWFFNPELRRIFPGNIQLKIECEKLEFRTHISIDPERIKDPSYIDEIVEVLDQA